MQTEFVGGMEQTLLKRQTWKCQLEGVLSRMPAIHGGAMDVREDE